MEVPINSTQQILSFFSILLTFLLGVIFAQILGFKPDWRWSPLYILGGTATSVGIYFTFFDKTFIKV